MSRVSGTTRSLQRVGWRCACALVLLGALACADDDKRAELQPAPFVMGSRYGRSPPRTLAPRNDRFFMGSRYGKRSEPLATMMSPELARKLLPGREPSAPATLLLCESTGLPTLYRCSPQDSRGHLQPTYAARRYENDNLEGEED